MVYFLGAWDMGDVKYTTCNHVSKKSHHEQPIHSINLESSSSNDAILSNDQTEVLSVNASKAVTPLSTVTKSLQTVTTVNTIDKQTTIINTSDNVLDTTLIKDEQQPAETQGEQLQHQLHQQQSSQLNQQTLTLSRATELIRQRSSSVHQIQFDKHQIHQFSSQQEYDDEVAVHPLSNQVRDKEKCVYMLCI